MALSRWELFSNWEDFYDWTNTVQYHWVYCKNKRREVLERYYHITRYKTSNNIKTVNIIYYVFLYTPENNLYADFIQVEGRVIKNSPLIYTSNNWKEKKGHVYMADTIKHSSLFPPQLFIYFLGYIFFLYTW